MATLIFTILILLVILGIVIAMITRPLYTMKTENVRDSEQVKAALNTQYQQILTRIRELEQEHFEGKLDDGDYLDRRSLLNTEAVEILKQLDPDTTQP